ncbi:hypothetical protein CYMTET_15296 [Cymbomonas tetramitiformis]|uniref:Integrase catalytic domain-containing protein n=1 Tax=Cymbomonas tetramitiformis TaxID=36881 RepID=A0AAE0GEV8_9CHLO|nr:hypothetical protein CYMTET_15296 [Cymbomonas tetramitiformis]
MATQASHAFRARTVMLSKDGTGFIRDVDLYEKARTMSYSADVLRRSGLSDVELQVGLGLVMDRRAMEALYAVSEVTTTSVARAQGVHPATRQDEQPQAIHDAGRGMGAGQAARADASGDGCVAQPQQQGSRSAEAWGKRSPAHTRRYSGDRRTWQLELWRPSQYETRARTTFVKARGAKESRIEIPEWAPAGRVVPAMRLSALLDTVRLAQLTASVMEQQSQRELCRDVHTNQACMNWLKSRMAIEPPETDRRMKGPVKGTLLPLERSGMGAVPHHGEREESAGAQARGSAGPGWWSLDLLKPGKVTAAGHRRILVMAGHYTRFVIAVPLPDKEANTIAWAFRNHVLSVFGASAECLVDGGGEFEGEFEKLCESCLIDRRVTSPGSPEGNGFDGEGGLHHQVLPEEEPTVPPDLKGKPALEFDTMPKSDADAPVTDMLTWDEVVKRHIIHAGCNLDVAQHRYPQRYQQHRVVAVKDTGVVTLEDRTGLKEKTAKMKRSKVKEASLLDWGLELVITAPAEVKRLSVEVDWSEIQIVWDPWAGTGVICKVLKAANPHLSVMNIDWNVHLGWREARDALQPEVGADGVIQLLQIACSLGWAPVGCPIDTHQLLLFRQERTGIHLFGGVATTKRMFGMEGLANSSKRYTALDVDQSSSSITVGLRVSAQK